MACGLVLLPSLACADPFADFRVPTHTLWHGRANLTGRAWWNDDHDPYGETEYNGLNSFLETRLAMDRDSDALQYGFSTHQGLSAQRTDHWDRRSGSVNWERTDSREETLHEHFGIGVGVRAYPWARPLGIQLTADGGGDYSQTWLSRERTISGPSISVDRRETENIVDEHLVGQSASGRIAFGYGRVRDATVVYLIHILEDRLLESGAISGPFPREVGEKLADIFYLRSDYFSVLERPDRYFWRDVEHVLAEAGLLAAGTLDAYSAFRANEDFQPWFDATRLRGWFFGPVAVFDHSYRRRDRVDYLQERDFVADSLVARRTRQMETTEKSYSDAFHAGGRIEYYRPLSWSWQLGFSSEVTAPMRPDEHGVNARNALDVRWLVADRWTADIAINHSRSLFEPRHQDVYVDNTWEVESHAVIAYYIENRTQLYAQVTQQQRRSEHPDRSAQFYRSTEFSLGIEYRFLGRLDAPGMIDPLRLTY